MVTQDIDLDGIGILNLNVLINDYLLNTAPIEYYHSVTPPQSTPFCDLPFRSKTWYVIRNLTVCFVMFFLVVLALYLFHAEEQIMHMSTVMASLLYTILRPILGKEVTNYDNKAVRTIWICTLVLLFACVQYLCYGLTLFHVANIFLGIGIILRLLSIVTRSFTSNPGQPTHSNIFIDPETFKEQSMYATRLWILRILRADWFQYLELGTLQFTEHDTTLINDIICCACVAFIYFVLHLMFGTFKDKQAIPFYSRFSVIDCLNFKQSKILRALHPKECRHEECSICLQQLCTAPGRTTAPMVRLSISKISKYFTISARKKTLTTDTVKLDCGHQFHKNCISIWIDKSRASCPYCRKNFGEATHREVAQKIRSTGRTIGFWFFCYNIVQRLLFIVGGWIGFDKLWNFWILYTRNKITGGL